MQLTFLILIFINSVYADRPDGDVDCSNFTCGADCQYGCGWSTSQNRCIRGALTTASEMNRGHGCGDNGMGMGSSLTSYYVKRHGRSPDDDDEDHGTSPDDDEDHGTSPDDDEDHGTSPDDDVDDDNVISTTSAPSSVGDTSAPSIVGSGSGSGISSDSHFHYEPNIINTSTISSTLSSITSSTLSSISTTTASTLSSISTTTLASITASTLSSITSSTLTTLTSITSSTIAPSNIINGNSDINSSSDTEFQESFSSESSNSQSSLKIPIIIGLSVFVAAIAMVAVYKRKNKNNNITVETVNFNTAQKNAFGSYQSSTSNDYLEPQSTIKNIVYNSNDNIMENNGYVYETANNQNNIGLYDDTDGLYETPVPQTHTSEVEQTYDIAGSHDGQLYDLTTTNDGQLYDVAGSNNTQLYDVAGSNNTQLYDVAGSNEEHYEMAGINEELYDLASNE
jgi:hypothetical protein